MFEVGDRVSTPTGRIGTVVPPPFEIKGQTLVQLDSGETFFFNTVILSPALETSTKKRKARSVK